MPPPLTFTHWILRLLLLALGIFGCSKSLDWVPEPGAKPSCIPDRLPTWDDYPRLERNGQTSAITAVVFYPKHSPPKIEMRFDYQRSWVKPAIADQWNPELVNESKRILNHEQLHFMISCLLTRQANQALKSGGNSSEMVQLVRAAAKRLNLQYDRDTNHGLNFKAQSNWEAEIQQQLRQISADQNGNY